MVVLVIASILAALALPAYDEFTSATRRGEGQNALAQVSAMQERWFTDNNSYTTNLTKFGFANSSWNNTENDFYRFRVNAASVGCPVASCYILETRPLTGSPQADDPFWFRIWSDGNRQTYDTATSAWTTGWSY